MSSNIFLISIVIVSNLFAIFACVLAVKAGKKMKEAIYKEDTGEHIVFKDHEGNEIDKKIKINIR